MLRRTKLLLTLVILFPLAALADNALVLEPIQPIPQYTANLNPEKVLLGKQLFNDTRLSKNQKVSCASCHHLNVGGSDERPMSLGINQTIGEINTPTVFNSSLNFRQFWNGRARNLVEQASSPIQNPKEMGSTWPEVLSKLNSDPEIHKRFQKLYPEGITANTVTDALATFESALNTPNCRFDKYLRGDSKALSVQEVEGYKRFKSYGCVSCHQGVNVGGNMFQTMGVMGKYFNDRGTPITESDLGRQTVTHSESDKFVFKVPSLRNVELTAPYFHDGSMPTLEKAVLTMGKYQLGKNLTKEDVDYIVAFLKTLTGEKPKIIADMPPGGHE